MEAKKNPALDINRYSRLFFLIGLCISISLVICAFEWTSPKPKDILPPPEVDAGIILYDIQPPRIHALMPTAPIQKEKVKAIIPTAISVIPDSPLNPDPITPVVDPEFTSTLAPDPEAPDTIIFQIVEKMPEPQGGYGKFYSSLSKEIKYPVKAARSQVDGRVFVQFTVNQNGESVDLKVIKGIGYGCDEEALRVLTKQKWEPGKQRGKPVRVRMIMPIVFKLN